jgi:hypothetical protein
MSRLIDCINHKELYSGYPVQTPEEVRMSLIRLPKSRPKVWVLPIPQRFATVRLDCSPVDPARAEHSKTRHMRKSHCKATRR